jgi:hypothetical protein
VIDTKRDDRLADAVRPLELGGMKMRAQSSREARREVVGGRFLAGVSVPDSRLIAEALEYAQRLYEPYLFNHAVRSWLFAETIGRIREIDYDCEVVAIGRLLHDIGLTASVSGPNRFEMNGADAARSFIKGEGLPDRRAQPSGTWLRSTRRPRSRFTRSRRWRLARWA